MDNHIFKPPVLGHFQVAADTNNPQMSKYDLFVSCDQHREGRSRLSQSLVDRKRGGVRLILRMNCLEYQDGG